MSLLTTLLEIAIVLAAIYVTLSCVVSAINEQIAASLQLRGKKLYEGVLNLVVGHQAITDAIFKHPLIAAASEDKDGTVDPKKKYRPSYVDARNFSMALWQSVQKTQSLPEGTQAAALVSTPAAALAELGTRVGSMEAGDLKTTLSALITAASGDYQQLLKTTDGWFNAQMDRVSGWYKRQTQWIMAVISAIVVLFCGIDSLEVGKTLYGDQTLRAGLADSISKSAKPATGGTATEKDIAKVIDSAAQTQLATFVHFPTEWYGNPSRLPGHVPGMFVTFLALLLGGPFWFDALLKLVNVRSAGRKPDRSDQPPQ